MRQPRRTKLRNELKSNLTKTLDKHNTHHHIKECLLIGLEKIFTEDPTKPDQTARTLLPSRRKYQHSTQRTTRNWMDQFLPRNDIQHLARNSGKPLKAQPQSGKTRPRPNHYNRLPSGMDFYYYGKKGSKIQQHPNQLHFANKQPTMPFKTGSQSLNHLLKKAFRTPKNSIQINRQ